MDVFNQIFGQDVSHVFKDKETLKNKVIMDYTHGLITKSQFIDKMEQLNRD